MWEGSWGLVGWVAILKMAAMASYSAQGGFSVSISTTVQARLLERQTGKKKKKWEPTATITLSVQRELPNRQHQGTALPWKCYKMALCSANAMCAQIHSQICQHRCFYRWQPSNKVLRQGAWFPLGSCCSENCEAPSVRLSFAQILLSVSICINNGRKEVHARCPWSWCWTSVVFQVLLLLSQMHLLGSRAENRLWAKVQ